MSIDIERPPDPQAERARVRVFDPAMCCTTGVCGPDVDADLVRFAADLDWLGHQGVVVERFNLAQQPGAFAADATARRVLQEAGEAGLPLIVVDGRVRSSGSYPSRELLSGWAGLGHAPSPTAWTPEIAELVAIGASAAANCVSCLSTHEQAARRLGIAASDIQAAVEAGRSVREASARRLDQHADRLAERAAAGEQGPHEGGGGHRLPNRAGAESPCCGGRP